MNRTAIEWTDFTWNPVTGCWGPGGTAEKPNRCSYCYAEKVARRFNGDRMNPRGPRKDPFAPEFYPHRLDQPAKVKKPSKIFVCSMADLFGDWVPSEWIRKVIDEAFHAPQHIFQFLTKNPKRLSEWAWPSNCWVGTTVTNQDDADERLPWLLQVDAPVRFVSHEPLLGAIRVERIERGMTDYWPLQGWWKTITANSGLLVDSGKSERINWAIIGAQTGPVAVKVSPEWAPGLMEQYQAAGVPVFIKDNLKGLVGCGLKDCPQEFPLGPGDGGEV